MTRRGSRGHGEKSRLKMRREGPWNEFVHAATRPSLPALAGILLVVVLLFVLNVIVVSPRFITSIDPSPTAISTGDMGYVDEEGFLFLRGRMDDMVKVADTRFYPREVVDRLASVPMVREAEVVPVRAEDGQTRLIAFVAMREGAEPDVSVIRRRLSALLPSHMLPQRYITGQALPRTDSGKLDRQALLREASAIGQEAFSCYWRKTFVPSCEELNL